MAKVTSKLQVTVPKAIAAQCGIKPGDQIEWVVTGETIRVIPAGRDRGRLGAQERLRQFDHATGRPKERNAAARARPARKRGWTREELYERGRSR